MIKVKVLDKKGINPLKLLDYKPVKLLIAAGGIFFTYIVYDLFLEKLY